MTKLLKKEGFTLIELLVVISIIGILATLVLANLNAARERGRDAQRKSDLRSIQTALRLYYNDYGHYPASDSSNQIDGCGSTGTTVCTWGSQWQAGVTTYMPILPHDPLSGQDYFYFQNNSDSYILRACLENASDKQGQTESGIDCSTNWMYQVSQ
jgi:general secretion pathway protein G